jgi:hypothetical protein
MNKLILICGFAVMFVVGSVLLADDAFGQCTLICPQGDDQVTDANTPPATRPIDVNLDGTVNIVEWALIVCAFPPNPYDPCWDLNCDGVVDIQDIALFAAHYCHSGPNPAGVCAGP